MKKSALILFHTRGFFFKTILYVTLLSVFNGCLTDDEVVLTLDGKWNLVHVSCECVPVKLEKGEVIWFFDLLESDLSVENNVGEQLLNIMQTGNYEIGVVKGKIEILSIEYDYYFDNGDLFLDHMSESDGPLIKLIRD